MEQEATFEEKKLAKIIFDILDPHNDERGEQHALVSGDPLDYEYQSTLIDGFINLIDLSRRVLEVLKEENTR
jgi:hypothetical protein